MLQIKIENFEGPLDLLLKLIEKQEMDITKISLAKIADQYVEHIRNFKEVRPEEIGDFLLVAAKLLFIKSKYLLPHFQWEEEEEDGEELAQQLKIYKEFLEAGQKIEGLIKLKNFSYVPQLAGGKLYQERASLEGGDLFSPPKKLKAQELSRIQKQILKDLSESEVLKEKMEEEGMSYKISLEERIEIVKTMVWKKVKFSFDKVVQSCSDKTEVIVSFLAILELSKQRVILTEQEELFATININPGLKSNKQDLSYD